MQICFHFDAYCRTEITGDVSKMLLRFAISTISLDIEDNIGAARKCLVLLFSLHIMPVIPQRFLFISLLISMIRFNYRSWDIGFLTDQISSHKYSPQIRSSMLKIVHIINVNRSYSNIFHLVNVRKIWHNFFCRFKVQQRVSSFWKMSCKHVLKMSFEDVLQTCLDDLLQTY